MNERRQVRDWAIKIGVCFLFAFCYSAGGSEDFGGLKILRRFLGPLILSAGMGYFSRDWRSLPMILLMPFSLSLGYGGDLEWLKILKRGVYGLANGVSSGCYDLLNKRWLLAGFQTLLLIAAYISFGVYNPFDNARIEEGTLGFLVAFIPMMSARRR